MQRRNEEKLRVEAEKQKRLAKEKAAQRLGGKKVKSQGDRTVLVMGPTGSGKSTFIDVATGRNHHTVGLQSHTSDIQAERVPHPTTSYSVVFVDFPGFDGTCKPDTEILSIIADWLVQAYKENVNITTIVYLHPITAIRMLRPPLKNLQMFNSICGQQAMPNVIIATTMWGDVKEEIGIRREAELKSNFWGDMVANGCRVKRFKDTYDSVWSIIDSTAEADRTTV